MALHSRVKASFDAGNRSSIFMSNSQDKRDLWWKAFRKTVLEPHAIAILENPMTDKVPQELLGLVEDKCQNLERHEGQALAFLDAVAQGRGFGSSPIFPADVVPELPTAYMSRCLEPAFDPDTIPPQEDSIQLPLFEIPIPRPGLVSGFSREAFGEDAFKVMPSVLTTIGTLSDYGTGRIQPGRTVYAPFLMFERTYGHAKHEIEFAVNYCAMNGAAALNAINKLYETAWPGRAPRPVQSAVVFSCTIDNDLGIINHHWTSGGGFFMAPLCKFDFRDLEHFMHFLAWIEAIEHWASTYLLTDIQKALQVSVDRERATELVRAFPSPVTDAEKQEKLSRSMKEAFDNIPWRGQRPRNTPLGVTSAMRMRSPKANAEPELVVTPMSLSHPVIERPEEPACNSAVSRDTSAPQPFEVTPEIVDTESRSSTSQSVSEEQKTPTMPTPPPEPVPALAPVTKRKKSSIGLSLVRSAGFAKEESSAKEARPVTSAGLEASKSPAASINTMPDSRPQTSKSPGPATGNSDIRSPASSMLSVQSKRSFSSLRSKKVKSPGTPDSSYSGASPKGSSFKSKISNGLGMIKEHTTSRRGDNSAPTSAKHHPPLPTPAYDKKRFDIKTPRPVITESQSSSIAEALSESDMTSQSLSHPSIVIKTMTTDEYNAKHSLPLRQYARSPTSATTQMTTLTAGA